MPVYMKIEGITGRCKGNYKGWIPLESCQVITNQIAIPREKKTNREATAAAVSEIVITKFQDDVTTALFGFARNGHVGKLDTKVTIDFTKSESDTAYLTIEMERVIISDMKMSGTGAKPMELIALEAKKMTFKTLAAPSANERNEWRSIQDRGS